MEREEQQKLDICQYLGHGAVNGVTLEELARKADTTAETALYLVRMARQQKRLVIERSGRYFLPSRNRRTAEREIAQYMTKLSAESSNAVEYR